MRAVELRERIAAVTGTGVRDLRRAGGQHGWQHIRVTLADGREAFAKVSSADTGPALEAEARGLRWLADAVAAPVPAVLGQDSHVLVVSWIPAGPADPGAAAVFGRELARLHAAGAVGYGAPWPGFIASLPLDNTPGRRRAAGPNGTPSAGSCRTCAARRTSARWAGTMSGWSKW